MKKSLVARGITGIVASLLGVSAVGCGADVGPGAAGDSAEIGSTEQALTAPGRYGAMSCILTDSSNSDRYLMIAGGIDGSGNLLDTIDAYKLTGTGSGAFVARASNGDPLFNKKLSNARAFGQGIARTSTACDIVGGENLAGAGKTDVNEITVAAGAFTISSPAAMGLARSHFQLQKCGATGLIAVAGKDGSTKRDTVEVFDGSSWGTVTDTLNSQRFDLALAPNSSSFVQFLAVGGDTGSGLSSDIDAIDVVVGVDGECDPGDVTINALNDNNGHQVALNTVRTKAVAFPKPGTANSFLVAAGEDASALSTTVPTIAVTTWSTGVGTVTSSGNATSYTAVSNAKLVYLGSLSSPALVGGFSNFTHADTSRVSQTFASGSWTANTTALTSPGRVDHVAEYDASLTGSKIMATSGQAISSSTITYPTADDKF